MNRFHKFPITVCSILLLITAVFAQSGIYTPDPDISANGTVRVVVIHDTILYVGGDFTRVTDNLGSYSRKGLAAFNLVTGLVTQFRADINRGIVRSIAVSDSMVYAGGTFTKINKTARSKVAALNPQSGDVIKSFSSENSAINGPVFALCCLDSKLFAGGNFTMVNGIERSYLAAFDMESGLLDSTFNPSPRDSMDVDGRMEGGVTALEAHPENDTGPGILFAGGNFQTVTGIENSRFLVALRSDGTPGPEFADELEWPVFDICCKGRSLYAGIGGFGNRATAYDISSSESYTRLWNGFVVKGDVQSITCSDSGFVYFSFHQGLFDTTDFYRCAVINSKTGILYDTLPSMNSFFGVWALDAEKDKLVAGGTFSSIDGRKQNHLAVFKIPPYQSLPSVPETVNLYDPPDSTIVNAENPKLKWKFVPYAEEYDLQIATDSLFENCIAMYSKISKFEKRGPELENCSRYFWRVRANNKSGSGSWCSEWRFYTMPGLNDIPEIVQPSDGAEYQMVSINCIWHAEANALSYDIQVSEVADFTTVSFEKSNSADTSVIISGLLNDSRYFLRVRSNTVGGPTEWANVVFSTVPAAARTPVLKAPVDNKMRVTCAAVLSWQTVTNATSYEIQLSTDTGFTNAVLDVNSYTDTSIASSELIYNTRYFWRVRALNQWGSSSWSQIWQFTTGTGYRNIPEIIHPVDGAEHQEISLSCVWHPVSDALYYSVLVSRDRDFMTVISDVKNISDTTAAITGLSNGSHYYLRVEAFTDSDTGRWACAGFTTVSAIPGMPSGQSPADYEIQVSSIPDLTWGTVGTAASYRVQLSTDSNFTANILDSLGLADTIVKSPELSMDTRYFWRVSALNDAGETWSVPMQFTTTYPVPGCPVALFPKSGCKAKTDSVKFVWSASSPHITDYIIDIANDIEMSDLLISEVTADTTYTLHGLTDNKQVFWRVRARNKTGESKYSATEVFTTAFPAVLRYSLNTFNFHRGLAHISYCIADQSDVFIGIFNLKGKVVWQSKIRNVFAGYHTMNMKTKILPAGAYILSIKAGDFSGCAGAILVE